MTEFNFNNGDEKSSKTNITEHVLRGEISHIVYKNEEGTYTVFRIKDEKENEHCVVGPITNAYEGQGIELKGVWENHREHGRQFRASSFRYILPNTPEGIKRYLASGLIPGIGPKLADCIVKQFGSQTLDILNNYSARLTDIPGFGKKRLEMVRKAWSEHAEKRDIFIFLQSLGISNTYCQRIFNKYGVDTPRFVKENPYRLAEDIDGIGFIMSDRIALNLGIEKECDARLTAGVLYSLNRLGESGHVCFPETEFIKYASRLLDVEDPAAMRGLELAVENGIAVRDNLPGYEKMVYSSFLFNAEKELASLINRLAGISFHKGQKILDKASGVAAKFAFNTEQNEAVLSVKKSPLSIITGGPGVGKTTVIGEIVRRAKIARLRVYLAAPTGRAAKRLSESCKFTAMTIHRMLKWDPARKNFVYGSGRPLPCDLLVIDEISMLDVPLALSLFKAVTPGTTVVMVGDADQLPSVGPGNFLTDLIMSGKAKITHLCQIYRQSEGSRIIVNAHAVNSGRMPDVAPVPKEQLSDFYWIDQDDPDRVVGIICDMMKDRIPKRFGFNPIQDIQVLCPMNKGSCGTISLNKTLQNLLNSENLHHKPQFNFGEQVFRSGDKVMQTSNNYDKSVFNGDLGRIVNINFHEKKFRVAFDAGVVDYDFIEADQLALAYAATIHKSQGSEFPAVVIPFLTQHYLMLQRKLLYTGMTRAKKLLVLIGNRKALAMAVKNIHTEPRFSMLCGRLRS